MTFFKVEDIVSLEQLKSLYAAKVLSHCKGAKTKAAEILGISTRTLNEFLKKYDPELALRQTEVDRIMSGNYEFTGLPSNNYRIRYRDEMINKDRL